MTRDFWLDELDAVFLDAVGTLIFPDPSAATVYAQVGQRHGSRLSEATVCERFRAAFAQEEARDFRLGLQTSEERENRRWQAIVTAVLNDVADAPRCFRELYEHFAQPTAWRCAAGTAELLAGLRARGLVVGLASNFDARLRSVVAGLPPLAGLGPLVISSEVGWRKPAPEFFAAVVRAAGTDPERILLLGDDLRNDIEGARSAGLQARLVSAQCVAELACLTVPGSSRSGPTESPGRSPAPGG